MCRYTTPELESHLDILTSLKVMLAAHTPARSTQVTSPAAVPNTMPVKCRQRRVSMRARCGLQCPPLPRLPQQPHPQQRHANHCCDHRARGWVGLLLANNPPSLMLQALACSEEPVSQARWQVGMSL